MGIQIYFKIAGSILSQKVPKFELYKHNDELFNIYYGIFYELWTFAEPPDTFLEENHPMTFIKILFLLSKWFQTRRFLWEFSIGSYVKLSSIFQKL
jgi:hypothetical protein